MVTIWLAFGQWHVFSAFHYLAYRKLLAQDMGNVMSLPQSILECFLRGFVVNLSSHLRHSVAIDKAHKIKINKECKTTIVRPSRDYTNRVAGYILYHVKCLENLREQLFPDDHCQSIKTLPQSVLSANPQDKKTAGKSGTN